MNKHAVLPVLTVLGGGAAFFLRLCQNRTGFDPSTGLPIPGNICALALPVLLTACALGLLWWVRRLPSGNPSACFRGVFTSAGTAATAVFFCGLLAVLMSGFLDIFAALVSPSVLTGQSGFLTGALSDAGAWASLPSRLRFIPGLSSVLCSLCLAPSVFALRVSGKRQDGTLQGELLLIPVVALVVRLVISYRTNSVNPILMAYYPGLLALILLILTFFRLASFVYLDGAPRRFIWYGAMAVILCITAAADTASVSEILFLCGMALVLIAFLSLLRSDPIHKHLP